MKATMIIPVEFEGLHFKVLAVYYNEKPVRTAGEAVAVDDPGYHALEDLRIVSVDLAASTRDFSDRFYQAVLEAFDEAMGEPKEDG